MLVTQYTVALIARGFAGHGIDCECMCANPQGLKTSRCPSTLPQAGCGSIYIKGQTVFRGRLTASQYRSRHKKIGTICFIFPRSAGGPDPSFMQPPEPDRWRGLSFLGRAFKKPRKLPGHGQGPEIQTNPSVKGNNGPHSLVGLSRYAHGHSRPAPGHEKRRKEIHPRTQALAKLGTRRQRRCQKTGPTPLFAFQ